MVLGWRVLFQGGFQVYALLELLKQKQVIPIMIVAHALSLCINA